MIAIEIAVVAMLIGFNGFLAMSELAVVSSRPARLRILEERRIHGARRALALAENPGRFLSTVQIGITLVGILSGAFSGATLGLRLAQWLGEAGLSSAVANALGFGLVVASITYVSLIVGELVPKQIALRNPEQVAVRVASFMTYMARIATPLVWVLDFSGRTVLRAIGYGEQPKARVTDEEIRTLIAEAETSGVIEKDESRMISGVMRLADRTVAALMTPRGEVDWIDIAADEAVARELLKRTDHALVPACDGHIDRMVGVIKTREALAAMVAGKRVAMRELVHSAPALHDATGAMAALSRLREAEVPLALIHDEYGVFEGILTPSDILEAIAGAFRSHAGLEEPDAVRRQDGSWLLAGSMPADEMAEMLAIGLPERRGYQTVAGFVLAGFQHLPVTGEVLETLGWRFEVVDLDGRRIDKVLATRLVGTE